MSARKNRPAEQKVESHVEDLRVADAEQGDEVQGGRMKLRPDLRIKQPANLRMKLPTQKRSAE